MTQKHPSPKQRIEAYKNNRASASVREAYDDFILSRKAMMVKPGTLKFYSVTTDKFVDFLEEHGLEEIAQLSARHVREYLASFENGFVHNRSKTGEVREYKPNYINGQARAIRAFVLFLHEEGYIPKPIKFTMPPKTKERPLILTPEQVQKVIDACLTLRDKLLITVLVDSGLRAEELMRLNWEDVDVGRGTLLVRKGKGDKPRTAVIGAKTRRLVITYRREVDNSPSMPFLQTEAGMRFTYPALRSIMVRLTDRSGVHVTAHALRRTFATLSLRAGMTPIHLQALMGHATMDMTREYVQLVYEDLMEAHREHGPVDRFL